MQLLMVNFPVGHIPSMIQVVDISENEQSPSSLPIIHENSRSTWTLHYLVYNHPRWSKVLH